MTLIVTVGCPKFVVQVSDRRFTRLDSRLPVPETDEGNKELVVRACDADFAISFTGLAALEGERTGDWLLECISDAKAAEAGFDACLAAVRAAADNTFARIAQRDGAFYHHTFVFAGFHHGAAQPRVAVVSNCESGDFRVGPAASTFSVQDISSARYPYHQAGMIPAMHADSKSRIKGLARRAPSYASVADLIVREVRLAASHAKYGRYIGKQCMSVCVRGSGEGEVEVEAVYHPTHSRPITYAPNLVDIFPAQGGGLGHMCMKDVQMLGGWPGRMGVGASGTEILDRRNLARRPPAP